MRDPGMAAWMYVWVFNQLLTCILAEARSCFSFQNAMRSSKGIYTLHIAEVAEVQRKQQSHAVARVLRMIDRRVSGFSYSTGFI